MVRPEGRLDPATHAQWYRDWLQIDPADRGWMRTYTVREHRAAGHPGNLTAQPEIDIDVVLHLDPVEQPGQGVAARWARDAQVGDTVSLLGPNRHLVGPDYGGIEFRPGTARTVLLVGDETALPAIGSILEALPASISGHALIEVPEAGDTQQLLSRSGVQVTWLPREGRPHGELLDAAVRRVMNENNAQAFRDAAADGPAAAGAATTSQGARGRRRRRDHPVGDHHRSRRLLRLARRGGLRDQDPAPAPGQRAGTGPHAGVLHGVLAAGARGALRGARLVPGGRDSPPAGVLVSRPTGSPSFPRHPPRRFPSRRGPGPLPLPRVRRRRRRACVRH